MREIYAKRSPEVTPGETAHKKIARRLASECVVLLENDGTLPFAGIKKLALYGGGARHTVKGGTGSGDVNSRTVVTVEEGLREAGYEVTTEDWLCRNEKLRSAKKQEHRERIKAEAQKHGVPEFAVEFANPFSEPAPEQITQADLAASQTDTAVYVIARNSGEGADRHVKPGDYLLYKEERENLTLLGAHYAHVVVVLNIGGVMDLSELKEIPGIGAVLLMSQLGNIGGEVLADVLSGTVTPSGKLTDTWAKRYEDYPSAAEFSHNDGDVDDEYYREGIYVGYRYFDTFGVEPLYCFGYGKSYTDFSVKTGQISVSGGQVKLSVTVTNTGAVYAGKEVVQVYVSPPQGALDKPVQELRAFAKTKLLAPGESDCVELSFAVTDLASYCEACASRILEAGRYVIRVGSSSRNTCAVAALVLDETAKTEELINLFALDEPFEALHAAGCKEKETGADADIPVFSVKASDIMCKKAVYRGERKEYTTAHEEPLTLADVIAGRCSEKELAAQLSVEELAELCVGTLRAGEEGSVVGNASYTVPGAAGDTTGILQETRGIANMILADGPAGLRLTPHFRTTKEGELLPGGSMLGDSVEPFDPNVREEDVDDYYQYCTAIPIGWALAQSWNGLLLEDAGDMVGEEMEEFHVDLWLAPALNIHRNPLCGRNFEYYSEDPLVSGKAAAAITRGVQKHPGKGTTIKHFAANNQEDNRCFTNAHIHERALREIYLKGFEIAVKESQPLSIMTSYNLINGIHAANSRDLLSSAARDEWGFEGVVMTDWFTSQDVAAITGGSAVKYPISASTGCIYAGNDLQMPGCKKNVTDIITAVKEGTELDGYRITLADLQFNAANVIRAAAKTTV